MHSSNSILKLIAIQPWPSTSLLNSHTIYLNAKDQNISFVNYLSLFHMISYGWKLGFHITPPPLYSSHFNSSNSNYQRKTMNNKCLAIHFVHIFNSEKVKAKNQKLLTDCWILKANNWILKAKSDISFNVCFILTHVFLRTTYEIAGIIMTISNCSLKRLSNFPKYFTGSWVSNLFNRASCLSTLSILYEYMHWCLWRSGRVSPRGVTEDTGQQPFGNQAEF